MKPTTNIRIATRNSPLALRQAEIISQCLGKLHPKLSVQIIGMTTAGDKHLETSLAKVGGKGLFVKELEQALLNNQADIAVHSMKDIPSDLAPGLMLASVFERDDPRDVLISNRYQSLDQLPERALIGTSSLRRRCQLKSLRPDIQVGDLRGNVQTRLRKLDEGEFDAIILAAAGLERLQLSDRIKQYFATYQFIPAVGQGALGIECRQDDARTLELIAGLNHEPTSYCVLAERAFNEVLGGGCQAPVAAYAQLSQQDELCLIGLVGNPDGSLILKANIQGPKFQAAALGKQLAKTLHQYGAKNILSKIYE